MLKAENKNRNLLLCVLFCLLVNVYLSIVNIIERRNEVKISVSDNVVYVVRGDKLSAYYLESGMTKGLFSVDSMSVSLKKLSEIKMDK